MPKNTEANCALRGCVVYSPFFQSGSFLIIDSIRNDPDWKNGEYTTQPRSAQFASVFFGIATSGGDQALYRQAPTRQKADELLDRRLKTAYRLDANDALYQWDSSRDYN